MEKYLLKMIKSSKGGYSTVKGCKDDLERTSEPIEVEEDESNILRSEVVLAMKKMRTGKTPGYVISKCLYIVCCSINQIQLVM